ncbi:MAG TPA: PEP-CTERM-box response regulator transcription factor [Acidobacteriota bacterium]|nr:PEP-CTERM-box response regulator transcription factor [Acidobacteriota bacterium]
MLPKLLVVDDDEQILRQIRWALSEDYAVYMASDRQSALDLFQREKVSVALLDLGLPPHPREAAEGLLALDEMIALNPLVKVIIVSGNSERKNALRAIERGAHDIFPKPVDLDALKIVLSRAFKRLELEKESIEERHMAQRVSLEEMIGQSPAMKNIFAAVRKVASTEVPVLILGESGTGKELIANAIHNRSARNHGPFVAINCAAIPETLLESELFGHEKGSFSGAIAQRRGKFEYAKGGTLFLDEIGDLVPELQVKILRFLQEKVVERVGGRESIHVDARVIAATNQDLEAAVKNGRFREDLYFRLAVVRLVLPPLRERGEDVIELAHHLAESYCREMKKPPIRFSKSALDAMRRHAWPGNVRELQNRVQRALVLSDGKMINPAEMDLFELPGEQENPLSTLKEARQGFERDIIARALKENDGNISKTARAIGISRPTLYELLERHGLR